MGILNDPTFPNIPGVEDFKGESFHTSRWPSQWSVEGKRVGIIGTGATAIQIIPEIAKLPLKSLTVFQRTVRSCKTLSYLRQSLTLLPFFFRQTGRAFEDKQL